MKRITVLAACSLTTSVYATPFMPMDARGLAMGNTGVASAKLAHSAHYNPALLSQSNPDDHFAILLPQLGINLADEDELYQQAQDIDDDLIPVFEDLFDEDLSDSVPSEVEALNDAAEALQAEIDKELTVPGSGDISTASENLQSAINKTRSSIEKFDDATNDLSDSLETISGSPLRARAGISAGIAFPSDKLAVAVTANADVNLSMRAIFKDQPTFDSYSGQVLEYLDKATETNNQVAGLEDGYDEAELQTVSNAVQELENYTTNEDNSDPITVFRNGEVTDEATDPELESLAEVAAIAVAEVGVSFARKIDYEGRTFSLGITPKLQKITTYHYVTRIDEQEDALEVEPEDSEMNFSQFNLDLGVSFFLDNAHKYKVGVVIKDLIGNEFELADVLVDNSSISEQQIIAGDKISLTPKVRVGISYAGGWFNVAADLDVTQNNPVAYENATQYLAFGGELDAFGWAQLRGGLRTNLAGDSNVASIGLGISPFGVHVDLALLSDISNPEKEVGAALETGFYF